MESPGPEIHKGWPVWFHHHGFKMQLRRYARKKYLLLLSHAARLEITAGPAGAVDKQWFISWKIQHAPYENVTGRIIMKTDELRSAFGLTGKSGKHGGWLIERFGAEAAEQGKYIRWREFLNIPGPGTGNDGDPNVSIEIDETIKEAVKYFLG